jgi:histidine ammonia-lyase
VLAICAKRPNRAGVTGRPESWCGKDNPVIVPDGEVMSTGNFRGEPLAFAADRLAAVRICCAAQAIDYRAPVGSSEPPPSRPQSPASPEEA